MFKFVYEYFVRIFIRFLIGALAVGQVFYPTAFAGELAHRYIAVHGDTLSEIVWAFLSGEIYGDGGNLMRVEKLNPHIKDPNHLKPGDEVILPEDARPERAVRLSHGKTKIARPAETEPYREISKNEDSRKDEPKNREENEKKTDGAVAAPAPEVAVPASAESDRDWDGFELSPEHWMTAISLRDTSTGASSKLVTKAHTSLYGNYVLQWPKELQSFIGIRVGTTSFRAPLDRTKTIENSAGFIVGYNVGARKRFGKLRLTGTFRYQDELFARAASTNRVTVDAISIPSAEAQFSYDLAERGRFVFGATVAYGYFLGTEVDDYRVEAGNSYGASIYFQRMTARKDPSFETEFGYSTRNQNGSAIEQRESSFGLRLKFFLPFGSGEGGGK